MLPLQDIRTRSYNPTPRVQVLVQDITQAICTATYCGAPEHDMCGHKYLAADVVRATIDHISEVLARDGNHRAVELLRGEM